MDNTYPIYWNGNTVGQAQVLDGGLYSIIRARMKLDHRTFYKLHLNCGKNKIDLGICIPCEGDFIVQKKIPRKLISENLCQFIVKGKNDIQICAQTPSQFDITMLQFYGLNTTQDGMELIVRDRSVNQPDSDQIP